MSFRETVLMERLGIEDAANARREIERNDAAHNGTMQRLFGIDWEDPSLYAIVLNTARVAIAECVECIVRLTETPAFRETPESRSALMDEVIMARVRFALERHFGAKSLQYDFAAQTSGGKVVLTGATTDEQLIVDAVRLLQGIEGVTCVESKVAHVAFVPHVN